MPAEFCSPKGRTIFERDGTCLSRAALLSLIAAYNQKNATNHKKLALSGTKRELWTRLDGAMASSVGAGNEAAWADRLCSSSEEVVEHFTPKMPSEWKRNEYAWLSNWDIDKVMQQYEEEESYKCKYLGTFSVDFATQGQCDYTRACEIDLKRLLKEKKHHVGCVINTDPHDKPGQHWIALFMVINPRLPCYGAYFYDSTASPPPPQVLAYMKMMRQKAHATFPGKRFRLAWSNKKMQWKNTECGVFSMAYIIRWLNMLKNRKGKVDMREIIEQNIDDGDIHKLRAVLYRRSF